MELITEAIINNKTTITGFALAIIAISYFLKQVREIVREFRAYNFLRTANDNTYKADFLIEKCFDAAIVIAKQIPDISDQTAEKRDRIFKEKLEGILNDIFPQNGLAPLDYKFEKLIEMEIYKRYKTLTMPGEVI